MVQREPFDLLHSLYQLLDMGWRYELPSPEQAENRREVDNIDAVCLAVAYRPSIVAQQGNAALLTDGDGLTFPGVETWRE